MKPGLVSYPLPDDWIKKIWRVYVIGHRGNREAVLVIKADNIMLNKLSQLWKDKCSMFIV